MLIAVGIVQQIANLLIVTVTFIFLCAFLPLVSSAADNVNVYVPLIFSVLSCTKTSGICSVNQ